MTQTSATSTQKGPVSEPTSGAPLSTGRDRAPGPDREVRRIGDRVFRGLSTGSGIAILVVLALVAAFLVWQGIPALTAPLDQLQYRQPFAEYVLPFAFGTVWAAFLALLMGVPVAIGVALFISHYAPRRLATGLGYVIDLLAAVPSVVFGLWGIGVLAPMMQPVYRWLEENLG